jgi:cytochrome P450
MAQPDRSDEDHHSVPEGLSSTERLLDPFPWYEEMRETAPIRYDERRECWDVFRYDDVKRVLSDHETFSAATASDFDPSGVLGTTMVDADPPEHERLRGVVDEYFSPGILADLSPSIKSLTAEQLDQTRESKREIQVVSDISAPVTVVTIARLLGIPEEQLELFKHGGAVMGDMGTGRTEMQTEDMEEQLTAAFSSMSLLFDELIDDRTQEPTDDLISEIAATESTDTPLTRDEQRSFCMLLFLAGHATTTHAVANALWTFATEGLYSSLRDGTIDRELAFDEVLRYRGPVQMVSGRRTTTAVELGDTEIPADEQVVSWIGSANRDPEQFDAPETFVPERTPNRHIAFGTGIHYCLGAPLARIEGDAILDVIFDRVEDIELATDSLDPIPSPLLYGFQQLPMTVHVES